MWGLLRKKDARADTAPDAEKVPPQERQGWLTRLKEGLGKTTAQLTRGINDVFTKRKLDAETLQELEDLLITADIGVDTAQKLCAKLRAEKFDKEVDEKEIRMALAAHIVEILAPLEKPLAVDAAQKPFVTLVIGVNGSGKTTSIGKIAKNFRDQDLKVMVAAGDTFRAAAKGQLLAWAERSGVDFFERPEVKDPAALAYEAVNEGKKRGSDVILIDTAGRLHNKTGLMEELKKIGTVLKKVDVSLPHEAWLILDATTGQNAILQAQEFNKAIPLTGLIVTKLDGTARGGVLVAIGARLQIPILAIGVGESLEDLQPFKAREFAQQLLGLSQ